MMARVQAGATAEPWAGPELCCWSQSGRLCRGEGAGVLSPRGPWGSGPTAVVTGTVPGLRRGLLGPGSGYGGTLPYRWIPKIPRARTPEGLVPANLSSGHRRPWRGALRESLCALPVRSTHTHPAAAPAWALPSHGSSETAATHGVAVGPATQTRESQPGCEPHPGAGQAGSAPPCQPLAPSQCRAAKPGFPGPVGPPPRIREGWPGSEPPMLGAGRMPVGPGKVGRPQSSARARRTRFALAKACVVLSTLGTRAGAQASLNRCFGWPAPFHAAGGGPRPVGRGRS